MCLPKSSGCNAALEQATDAGRLRRPWLLRINFLARSYCCRHATSMREEWLDRGSHGSPPGETGTRPAAATRRQSRQQLRIQSRE